MNGLLDLPILGIVGSLMVLIFGALAAWIGNLIKRLNTTERRLDNVEKTNKLQWLWSKELVDHIYRGLPPPPPPPPKPLLDLKGETSD